MSDPIDTIEHMFEYVGMSVGGAPVPSNPSRGSAIDRRVHIVSDLQKRMRELEPELFPARELPTDPLLAGMLPGGAVHAGGVYSVRGSLTLAMIFLSAASMRGMWTAAVGLPDLGVEAAAWLGVDLSRLVLIPHPGDDWWEVVSALVDTTGILLVSPPARVDEAAASRLASRLRRRESALVVVGSWPRADALLQARAGEWAGIGRGHGRLRNRRLDVAVFDRSGRRSVHHCRQDESGIVLADVVGVPNPSLGGAGALGEIPGALPGERAEAIS